MASIAATQNHQDDIDVLTGIKNDLTALRTAITTLTAKLDADTGVADANYAATCNPAALETTA